MLILFIVLGIILAFWIVSILIRKGVKFFLILLVLALIVVGYFGIDFISQGSQINWAFWQ